MSNEFPIVLLKWVDIRDHEEPCGYTPEDAVKLDCCLNENTVGYLLKGDDEFVWLANDYSPIERTFRRVQVTPRGNVKELIYLEETSVKIKK